MWDALPPFPANALGNPPVLLNHLHAILESAPLGWFLEPFRWVVAPYFAQDLSSFMPAIAPAFAILALHYWWVIRSDVAFEEASVDASRMLAERIAAARSGNWQTASGRFKASRPPFDLSPIGLPALGFAWKNMVAARGVMNMRLWIVLLAMGLGVAVGMGQSARSASLATVALLILSIVFTWTILLGPQFLRQDFRQDLPMVDVLKSLPLPGWQVALGQVLGPALVLAMMHWALIGITFGVSMAFPMGPGLGWRLAAAFGAALLLPLLDVIAIQVPNLAVLLFPAWFQTGRDAPQGIEGTGQRIVLLIGQMLVFVVATALPAGVFFMVFVVAEHFVGSAFALVAASMVSAVMLGSEAALGILVLGRIFERFEPGEQAP
jgi:hypothetical protein